MANEIVENAGLVTANGENLLGDKLFIDGVFDTVGLDGNKNLQSTEDEPVEAGIVCPRLGTTGSGTVTIDNVRYAGPLYPNITTASTDSSVVAVQGGSFRNAHQDILRDRIGVIDDSWFHNTTAGNRHGAALSLFDGSKTTITGSTFTNNSNTSGNGGAIGGSTASSIDSGGGSELTLQNCFFANNISTGQCGGAIYGSTNSQLTISGSTFTCNTANNYGGVIYATTRVELKISDSVFFGNIVTKGNGGAIHLEREVSATITGSTFSGNTAGVKTAGLGGAITVCFNSSLFVSGCTFAGNIAYNYAGAIFVNSEGKSTTIENCVFATKSDSIVIDTGTVSFSGTITLASDVRKENHPDRGHYLCSTDKVDFVFINEESISIAKLDNAENIRSLSFRSTEMVNFTDLELSDTILNIDCELPSLGQSLSIAGGLTSLGSGTITVHGKNAVGGKAFFEGSLYKVYLSDNFLTITSEEYVRAAIVTSNGAEWVQVGSTNYAGNFYPSIDAALEQEDFVVMQGTFATRSSVTGANKRAVISQTDVTGNAVDVNGGALMISEGFASITASAFSRNVARNGGAIANDEGRLIISGNTFTDNTAMQNGGAVYCATGGEGSVENALFTGNIAREAGGAVYCADAASALSISGSTFTDNAAIQNGGAIYLKDGTVNITDCVFSATSDTIYNDDGVLTLGGTVWTAANITSTNAISVEENTSLVLDLSVYAGTTSKELLTNYNTMFGTTQSNLSITINVASDQIFGKYVLAAGVNTLRQTEFTITLDGDTEKSFTVSVGGATEYDSKNYMLQVVGDTLSLDIEIVTDTGIVTVDGGTDTVVIAGATYTGKAYRQEDIGQALDQKQIVAAQGVSYTQRKSLYIAGKTLLMDQTTAANNYANFGGGAIYNDGTTTISGSTFTDNAAADFGGAVYNSYYGALAITGSTFTGNTADRHGGAVYTERAASISDGIFTGNAAKYDGGAVCNDGTASVTGSIFTGNTAGDFGGAVCNSETASITGSTFTGNAAGQHGGAVCNWGTVTVTDSVFATEADTVYNDGSLTLGGAINTAAQIWSNDMINFEKDTCITLDLSAYSKANTVSLLGNYDIAFAASADLSIAVSAAADQAVGDYILADTFSAFDKRITIVSGGEYIGTVGVGECIDRYTLLRVGSDLVLSVAAKPFERIVVTNGQTVTIPGGIYTNPEVYHENGGAAEVMVGGTLIMKNGAVFVCNTAGWDGGAVYNSGTVSISGSTFSGNSAGWDGGAVYNSGTVSISGSTFSGNSAASKGGAIFNSSVWGRMTIRDSVFTTANDAIWNNNGEMVFGGTIWTAANIYSVTAVTVEENTSLVLDLSVYAGTTSKELLTNYNTMFGESQKNLTISINVASDQIFGKYVLAAGVNTLRQTEFTITLDGDTEKSFTVSVGGGMVYGSNYYSLMLADGTLSLTIQGQSDVGVVTFDGGTDTVVIEGATYTGKAYRQEDIGQALDQKQIVAAQDVTLSGFTVSSGQTFVGDNITMSETSAAIYNEGTMTLSGTITTGANITSTKAFNVEADTQLVLDFSARTADMGEMLTDYNTSFSEMQSNLSITINADQEQSMGVYTLATNATKIDCPITFDINNEFVAPLDFVTKVISGKRVYRLDWNNLDIQFIVKDVSDGKIFGGDTILSEDTAVSEVARLNIKEGSFVAAAGGVYATNCRVDINTDTNVSVADGSFSNIVCAGSIVNENVVLTVNDASRLTISGGTFANAVAGGNYIQSASGTVYGGRSSKSNTYVNITGGTFLRDIYGGNIAAKNSFATTTNSYITGSTNITIDASENVVSISGNLVAGSSGVGQIIGSTNLTFTGNADKLLFGSKSIVCGDSHDATTAVSCVGSAKTVSRFLNFDDFTGTLDAKVVGFDQVNLSGGSVTLAKSSRLSDVSSWNFSGGAILTFENADNNFRGDTLTFGTFDGNEWTVVSGSDSTLANWDWADQVTIAGQNASFDESLGYWTSADYKFYKEDNALIVAKKGQIA